MKENLRKVIREIVEEQFAKYQIPDMKQIVVDLPFLKQFDSYSENHLDTENKEWNFYHSHNDNDTEIKIFLKDGNWNIYYKISSDLKNQTGDYKIGPIDNYDDFIFLCNNKLKNNPLLDIKNSHNDRDDANEQFIEDMIKILLNRKEELLSLPDGHLDDLKKIYFHIKGELDKMSMDDLISNMYSKNKNLNGYQLVLGKVNDIDYHKSMVKNHQKHIQTKD